MIVLSLSKRNPLSNKQGLLVSSVSNYNSFYNFAGILSLR